MPLFVFCFSVVFPGKHFSEIVDYKSCNGKQTVFRYISAKATLN